MTRRANGNTYLPVPFSPSRLRWFRRIGTMASADFCSHEPGYPGRPAFRASSTHGYAHRSPRIRTQTFAAQAHHLPWSLSGTVLPSRGGSPQGLSRPYGVSVRSLAALARITLYFAAHSQASSPRFVTSPQLPSPST